MDFCDVIKNLQYTPADLPRREWMGNWTYLAIRLQNMDPTPRDLLALIKMELERPEPRKHVVSRLKTRFNTARNTIEWRQIEKGFDL